MPGIHVAPAWQGVQKGMLIYHYLYEVLQLCVDAASNGIHEDGLHPQHQHLKALDHRQHFNQTKLLITAVVVPRRLQTTTQHQLGYSDLLAIDQTYTVSHKKGNNLLLSITSSKIKGFQCLPFSLLNL